jgi:minimal PKS chain-length factor (CLF/KS beta)
MSAVVTGLGVVAPNGTGVEEYWRATLEGRLAVTPIEGFDTTGYGIRLAGQVRDFDVREHVDDRIAVQTDRWSWFSLACARAALTDARYDPAEHDPYDTGVVLASASGGNEFGQREISALWTRGRTAVSAYQSIAWFYAASTGQASIHHGTKGPSGVVVAEAAGGLDSVAQARRLVRRGTGAVLAGGTEAGVAPYALACQATSGRLSAATDPRRGYKPFDSEANGYVPGEGGAVLLVEDAGRAHRRGAPQVYGTVAGSASTHDAHHYQDAPRDPGFQVLAMRRALDDAGVSPDDVDVVFADGAGVPEFDELEAAAVRQVFGTRTRPVPVTAPQGWIGRLSAGGAALNVAAALLAMRDGVVPAVGNLDDPRAAPGLDLVREPREMPVRTALVNARGYGGFNSSLVVRAPVGPHLGTTRARKE